MKRTLIIISLFFFLSIGPLHAAKVDINKADAQTLQENLVGVGEVKAKAIVKYRRQHGKFKSMDDLMQVPGIGEATIKKNRRNLSLKGGASTSKKTSVTKKTSQKKDGKKTSKSKSTKKDKTSKEKAKK